MSTAKTPVLRAHDLSDEIQTKVYEIAQEALDNYKVEREIAAYVKKEMDQLYGPTWHVVVGESFGSYVSHEQGCFTYFFLGELAFLIFKSG